MNEQLNSTIESKIIKISIQKIVQEEIQKVQSALNNNNNINLNKSKN